MPIPEQLQELEKDGDEQYEVPQIVQQENVVNESVQSHPEPQFEEIQTTTRRSKRIPKLSAKALNLLEYDQWYNNDDD